MRIYENAGADVGLYAGDENGYDTRMRNAKDEIWELHEEYYAMFGELPPVSPDDDFYSESLIEKIKLAIASGRPL